MVAVPLAPFLYKKHFVVLVLLRPTKEVLLAAGFFTREHDVSPLPVIAAALPLMIFGVWHFYFLGRAYSRQLEDADMPGIAGKMLSPERIKRLRKALSARGAWVVLLGRLAVFPSTLMAAAAGTSEMPRRTFFVADGVGAMLSIAEAYGAGYALGQTYDEAGPWLSGVGFAVLAVMLVLAGRHLRRLGE